MWIWRAVPAQDSVTFQESLFRDMVDLQHGAFDQGVCFDAVGWLATLLLGGKLKELFEKARAAVAKH